MTTVWENSKLGKNISSANSPISIPTPPPKRNLTPSMTELTDTNHRTECYIPTKIPDKSVVYAKVRGAP